MGYAFMTIQKVHSLGTLGSMYKHNYRIANVDNADPSLKHLNEELVKLPINEYTGKQYDYTDAFRKRMTELPYYRNHEIRKNAVLAYDIVTTFSREENIDLETWKKKNVLWLQDTFNKAPDGRTNILSVVYHADEPGNVHCHAIVVPIDEKGKLNARSFTGGYRKMVELQTSYAKYMEEFGLERGLMGSSAKHKDIRKYYAELNAAKQIEPPRENELASQYRERLLEDLETMQLAAKRERDQALIKQQRKMDEQRIKLKAEITEQREQFQNEITCKKIEFEDEMGKARHELDTEIQLARTIMEGEKSFHEEECAKLKEDIQYLERKQKNLENQIIKDEVAVSMKLGDIDEVKKKVQFYENFKEGLTRLAEADPDRMQEMQKLMKEMSELRKSLDKEKECS